MDPIEKHVPINWPWSSSETVRSNACLRATHNGGGLDFEDASWWSWTRSRSSEIKEALNDDMDEEKNAQLRTVLNGGERDKSMTKMQEKEKIEDPPQDQPKWWRSGGQPFRSLLFP